MPEESDDGEGRIPTVFVSYSHEDKQYLDEVLPHLRALELNEHISLWDDRLIGVGEDWYRRLKDEMNQARVAILLVSANFLSSRFCKYEEVPLLLQRQRRGELAVFPLLISDCLWDDEPWLRRLQMIPGGTPLARQGEQRQAILTELARQVRDVALNGVVPPKSAPSAWSTLTHDLTRLPGTDSLLFGRRRELALLDAAWAGKARLISFHASAGFGKSTLVRVWTEMLGEAGWEGAERALAWSFAGQGRGAGDSESFVEFALNWFDPAAPVDRSPWDRGRRLAALVRRRRTLLVLDGIEGLQFPSGPNQGSIRDPALCALLDELVNENPGLCIVTSQHPLAGYSDHGSSIAPASNLNQVSKDAGRALLRTDGVWGSDQALERVVTDLGGHALALSLLGSLLADGSDTPHIAGAKQLSAKSHSTAGDAPALRVLDAWYRRLEGSPELELLSVLSMFLQVPTREAIEIAVKSASLPQLADLSGIEDLLGRLRRARLVDVNSTGETVGVLHSVVREYFENRFRASNPKAWGKGHQALYEHYKRKAAPLPSTIKGMEPLFAAIPHGCRAEPHPAVLQDVFYNRVSRGADSYLVKKLGGSAAAITCLYSFFSVPWTRLDPSFASVGSQGRGWVLANAGQLLRAVGRLEEALQPMERALRIADEAQDPIAGALSAGNLSEINCSLGRLSVAADYGRRARSLAEGCKDLRPRVVSAAEEATARYHLGEFAAARGLFIEAEQVMAVLDPRRPILQSLNGYWYCELLLFAEEADEVADRAAQTLEWASEAGWLLDIALDSLSLGRAHQSCSSPDLNAAEEFLEKAVDGLRTAGMREFLPLGLLARASFRRSQAAFDDARGDLIEARMVVRRAGMRRLGVDLDAEWARWHLARNEQGLAKAAYERAKEQANKMAYQRMLRELESLERDLPHVEP